MITSAYLEFFKELEKTTIRNGFMQIRIDISKRLKPLFTAW